MRDATVSDFFYKESKSKKIKKFLFFVFLDVAGGGGAVVDEGGYSKRISLSKNPNVNKKNVGGGGGMRGCWRVRWGLERVFFI